MTKKKKIGYIATAIVLVLAGLLLLLGMKKETRQRRISKIKEYFQR